LATGAKKTPEVVVLLALRVSQPAPKLETRRPTRRDRIESFLLILLANPERQLHRWRWWNSG
jgi:hypothetical protein